MYKIHNALSRSTIPTLSLQKSVVVSKSSTTRQPELFLGFKKASQSNEEKFFNSVHSFDISKVWLNRPQPMRYENIPAQKSVDPELVKALDDAWTNFVTDQATGKPDENIVTYSNSEPSTIPEDFVPLDVDKFMAKQILATLNIDLAVLN